MLLAMNSLEDRILAKCYLDEETGCLLWFGAVDSDGYGTTSVKSKTYRVHREAYKLWVGKLDSAMQVDHECHNLDEECINKGTSCLHRLCINPGHLEARSQNENQGRRRRYFRCGHDRFGENVYTAPGTKFDYCITCRTEREAKVDTSARWKSKLAKETDEQAQLRKQKQREKMRKHRAKKREEGK